MDLELDAGLSFDTRLEVMLHQRHLCDHVGSVEKRLFGVSPGHHDMQAGSASLQRFHDFLEREIVIAQCDIKLIENHKTDRLIGHEKLCLRQ